MLEDDEVVVRAATGQGEDDAIGTRAPSTGFLVGDLVQTRSTRALADVWTDLRLARPTRCWPRATWPTSAFR